MVRSRLRRGGGSHAGGRAQAGGADREVQPRDRGAVRRRVDRLRQPAYGGGDQELASRNLGERGDAGPAVVCSRGCDRQIKLTIDHAEEAMIVDLTEAASKASVMEGIFWCLDPTLPHNQGAFDRVRFELREGCIVGIPKFPVGTSVATTFTADRMASCAIALMAKVDPARGEGIRRMADVGRGCSLRVQLDYLRGAVGEGASSPDRMWGERRPRFGRSGRVLWQPRYASGGEGTE